MNMSAKELKEWLDTPASKEVAQKSEGHGSTGHASGRRIIKTLGKKKGGSTRRLLAYAQGQRLCAAAPGAATGGRCARFPLAVFGTNWGQDPLKS